MHVVANDTIPMRKVKDQTIPLACASDLYGVSGNGSFNREEYSSPQRGSTVCTSDVSWRYL